MIFSSGFSTAKPIIYQRHHQARPPSNPLFSSREEKFSTISELVGKTEMVVRRASFPNLVRRSFGLLESFNLSSSLSFHLSIPVLEHPHYQQQQLHLTYLLHCFSWPILFCVQSYPSHLRPHSLLLISIRLQSAMRTTGVPYLPILQSTSVVADGKSGESGEEDYGQGTS